MEWRVGVLRVGAEDVAWTDHGQECDWSTARASAREALRALAGQEGRQEYRIQVGDVGGIVMPGVGVDGSVELDGLGESFPIERG